MDRKLLALLQQDSTRSIAHLAEQVGLLQTPCWKRLQRLESDGVIERRLALLSPEKLGLGLTVFVSIEAGHKRLIAAVPIKNVSSQFSMERIKSTTALPLEMAG